MQENNTQKTLGELKSVDLREVWKNEAGDFTPWLAEHIDHLAEAIGIAGIEKTSREEAVGPFSADILCEDENGERMLVENQLEKSDHKHLGQILTYAAGLRVQTIVWVAREFADEHRAALDWLNANTGDGLRFFGLEVELWRIGESQPAPKFNVVVQPNNWSKTVRRAGGEGFSDTQKWQLHYWETLLHSLEDDFPLKNKQASPRNLHAFSVGKTGCYIAASIKKQGLEVRFHMWNDDAEAFYGLLNAQKSAIEQDINMSPLHWEQPTNGKKRAYISVSKEADATDESDWQSQHKWMANAVREFNRVFAKRVKDLNPEDWTPEQ